MTKQTPNERAASKAAKAARKPAKRSTRAKQASKPAKAAKPATRPAQASKPEPKPEPVKQPCCCGCGAMVRGLYRQGHDARHKGHLLDIATGQTPKHAPVDAATLKSRGYTAERLAERGTVIAGATTADEARATIARLGWSGFLDMREAKLAAAAERKAAAQARRKVREDARNDAAKAKAKAAKQA